MNLLHILGYWANIFAGPQDLDGVPRREEGWGICWWLKESPAAGDGLFQ